MAAVAAHDLLQRRHSLLRNFPVIGHGRYFVEKIGPDADSVSLPFRVGFSRVYAAFAERGLQDDVVFVGAGKLGLPDNAVVAFALGCDMVNVGREAMLAIGCIQAQKCHTDHCPTGVATQNRWLTRGLDPTMKSVRVANYIKPLRRRSCRARRREVEAPRPLPPPPPDMPVSGCWFASHWHPDH